MALSFSTSLASAILDSMKAHIDHHSGDTEPVLLIYSGTIPANANDPVLHSTSQVLAKFKLATPCAPASSSNTLTLSQIVGDSEADATGTATYFRIGHISPSSSAQLLQGSVGAGTGTADLVLDSVNIQQGQKVTIVEAKFILP